MTVRRPRLTGSQWVLLGVVVFVVAAVGGDVLSSLPSSLASGAGAPRAQLNGRLPGRPLVVGRTATLDLALDLTAGGAMSPACVAGNLTPVFRVVRVTVLDTRSGAWRSGESCGGILEARAVVPVVITVVPRFPGRYAIHLVPAVRHRRVGSGTSGLVTIVAGGG